MNVPLVILTLACLAFVIVGYFAFEVLLFRLSCSLAQLPRPTVPKSVGVVFGVLFAEILAQGALGGIVTEAYIAGGYPLWEAGLVAFFLALPVHMVVCAAIHARLVGIRFSDGIAVWKIEKSIKFAITVVGGSIVGLILLIGKA